MGQGRGPGSPAGRPLSVFPCFSPSRTGGGPHGSTGGAEEEPSGPRSQAGPGRWGPASGKPPTLRGLSVCAGKWAPPRVLSVPAAPRAGGGQHVRDVRHRERGPRAGTPTRGPLETSPPLSPRSEPTGRGTGMSGWMGGRTNPPRSVLRPREVVWLGGGQPGPDRPCSRGCFQETEAKRSCRPARRGPAPALAGRPLADPQPLPRRHLLLTPPPRRAPHAAPARPSHAGSSDPLQRVHALPLAHSDASLFSRSRPEDTQAEPLDLGGACTAPG